MNRCLVVATTNMHKLREFREMLCDLDVEVLAASDIGIFEFPEEVGSTFAENALIKVRHVASRAVGSWVVADDSGLCVEALEGKPGVRSARFAGCGKDDDANVNQLLEVMGGVSMDNRTAAFYCAVALISPTGRLFEVSGVCNGRIAMKPSGSAGFGYDPVFIPNGYDKTFAEMDPAEKNKISHRGIALRRVREVLVREVC